MPESDERNNQKRREGKHLCNTTNVLHPPSDTEAEYGYAGDEQQSERADDRSVPPQLRQRCATPGKEIGRVSRDSDPECGDDQDGVGPQVPGDHESREFPQRDRRPLIDSALERHQAAEVYDHPGLREIVQSDREKPENGVGGPELGGRSDPARPYDIEDLHQH